MPTGYFLPVCVGSGAGSLGSVRRRRRRPLKTYIVIRSANSESVNVGNFLRIHNLKLNINGIELYNNNKGPHSLNPSPRRRP